MFQNWGFLLGEIWLLLLGAAILGLVVGWLFWGRRLAGVMQDLEAARYTNREKQARVSSIEEELRLTRAKHREEINQYEEALNKVKNAMDRSTNVATSPAPAPATSAPAPAPAAAPAPETGNGAQKSERPKPKLVSEKPETIEAELPKPKVPGEPMFAPGTIHSKEQAVLRRQELMAQNGAQDVQAQQIAAPSFVANTKIGTKPPVMQAPRSGVSDDLQRIKGVGPRLEELLNRLGFFHFEQIAAWGDEEVAWVDNNLEGFSGRVARDNWVAQAKKLVDAPAR